MHNEEKVKSAKSGNHELICERQGKHLYQTDTSDYIIQEFHSENSGNRQEGTAHGIDTLRNQISSYLFEYLEGFHIPNHFVAKNSDTEMTVKRTDIIQFSVKVFNIVNGIMMKRYNFKENIAVEFPIFEHYFTNGNKTNAWINEHHVYAFSLATPVEFKQINRIAAKANAVLRGLCDRRGLALADIQMEFGRYKGQVMLIDELSPLTCHFLDVQSEQKTKRDRFSLDSDNAEENIRDLAARLMLKI